MVATRSRKRGQTPASSTVSNAHHHPSNAAYLPAELLTQIFLLVSKKWVRGYEKKHNPVIHVCKAWRKAACGIPGLWLPIDCSNASAEAPALTSELKTLKVTVNGSAYPEGKKKPNKFKPMERMALFMDRDMPRLRELYLNGFSILPWTPERTPSFPSLTSLSLIFHYGKNPVSLSQILPTLSSIPFLEDLLLGQFALDLENIAQDTIVNLPCLKRLSVTSKLYFAALALRPLRFPANITLQITSADITFSAPGIEATKQAFTAESVVNGCPIVGLDFYITQQEFTLRTFGEGYQSHFLPSVYLFSFSETDTSMLFDLVAYFTSTFSTAKSVQYGFFRVSPPPPTWDWSCFVTPLTCVETLLLDYALLSTVHQFVANTQFGSHLPKLKKLSVKFDTDEIFMDSEGDIKRVVGDFIKDLLKQLDVHCALYGTIDVVDFHPFEINDVSLLDAFDADTHYQWKVVECDSLQGTRVQE
ncbi:hypothetical protein ONZ45_g15580 [Pleurotus djamor]|nr:hypothetical protein ONZ45_g15580 [Pleurotus djamor]